MYCNIYLARFPFGEENCNFWITLKKADGEKSKNVLKNFGGEHSPGIFTRKSNGDYVVSAVTHRNFDYNGDVGAKVSILFKPQYGYYILNNYLPSFLMFVIAYSTFFFPLSNFNERVMVPLLRNWFWQLSSHKQVNQLTILPT